MHYNVKFLLLSIRINSTITICQTNHDLQNNIAPAPEGRRSRNQSRCKTRSGNYRNI